MKNTKTFNVVMLPSNRGRLPENGALYITDNGILLQNILTRPRVTFTDCEYQHLYITSTDEIQEGDWCIHDDEVKQAIGSVIAFANKHAKKIVATTDKLLQLQEHEIKDNRGKFNIVESLPQIPESFIQAYIKAYNEGKPITEVYLEMEERFSVHGNKHTNMDKPDLICIIKTRPDNTVIVHQSKLYTRDEVVKLFDKYFSDWADHEHPGAEYFTLDKWIEENL